MRGATLLFGVIVAAGVAVDRPVAQGSTAALYEFLDRYERADFQSAVWNGLPPLTLQRLVTALEVSGEGWIARGPDTPRRRIVAASFALESGHSLLNAPNRILYRRLVGWACDRLRTANSEPLIVSWYLASLALVELAEDWDFLVGSGGPGELRDGHLAHATKFLEKEPRLRIASVLAAEARSWSKRESWPLRELARRASSNASPSDLATLERSYRSLMFDPTIEYEARLRLAVTKLRIGDRAGASELLAAARPKSDRFLIYLFALAAGTVEEAANRPVEAINEYRLALDAQPGAETATVFLATALMSLGRRTEAAEAVEALFAAQDRRDPWRLYLAGDGRFWNERIATLRTALR